MGQHLQASEQLKSQSTFKMENRRRQIRGGAATSLALFLIIAIFLPHAAAAAENTVNPTANQNLNPTQAWRSSEYCMRNMSAPCQSGKNHTLTASRWLNVTAAEGPDFCKEGGCGDHTKAVLGCLTHVKRDYWFANNATLQDLYDTITNGCANGFTGVSKFGSYHRK